MTLLMPMTTWDTLNVLCFDRKVLMVGVDDGDDVASVAQTAHVLSVYAGMRGQGADEEVAKIEDLYEILQARRLGHTVVLNRVPAMLGVTAYLRGQFDVAVYNPGACQDHNPGESAAFLSGYVGKLIVVGQKIPELWDEVCSHLPQGGYSASSDGSAIFVTMGPPEPIVRQD